VFRGGVGATTEIADTKIFLEMFTTIQQRSDAYLRGPNLEWNDTMIDPGARMLEDHPVIQHTSANMKVLLKNNVAQKR
jgi:hypothetical protein